METMTKVSFDKKGADTNSISSFFHRYLLSKSSLKRDIKISPLQVFNFSICLIIYIDFDEFKNISKISSAFKGGMLRFRADEISSSISPNEFSERHSSIWNPKPNNS